MGLIDSELSLAVTMSDLAETEAEIGDQAHARVLLKKVGEAIATVREHTTDNQISDDERREIEERVRELTTRLDAAKQEVFGES